MNSRVPLFVTLSAASERTTDGTNEALCHIHYKCSVGWRPSCSLPPFFTNDGRIDGIHVQYAQEATHGPSSRLTLRGVQGAKG